MAELFRTKTADDMFRILDDPEFWTEARRIMVGAALPIFQELFMAGVEEAMLETFGTKALEDHLFEIGQKQTRTELRPVDQDLLTTVALERLEIYTDNWWEQIESTTRKNLRAAIGTAVREGESTDQLIKRIEPTFGKARAQRIAITESTRLMTEGQLATYDQLGVTQLRWKSVHDMNVCPRCKELEEQTRENPMQRGFESVVPPAHPGCRCRLSPVLDDEEIERIPEPVVAETELKHVRPFDPKDKVLQKQSRELTDKFLRRNTSRSLTDNSFRAEAKKAVAKRLNARLVNDPTIKKIWGKNADSRIKSLISKWADTSADNNPYAIAMQRAVAEEFGLSTEMLPKLSGPMRTAYLDIWKTEGKALRRFVRVMYEETQSELAAWGIDEVVLYRGMQWDIETAPKWITDVARKSNIEIDIIEMPLSSFSSDFYTSRAFATGTPGGTVSEYIAEDKAMALVQVVVPRENVLSTPWTGFGCLSEEEFTMLQSTGKMLVSRL